MSDTIRRRPPACPEQTVRNAEERLNSARAAGQALQNSRKAFILSELAEKGLHGDRPAREPGREKEGREEHPHEDLARRGPRIPSSRTRHRQEAIDSRGAALRLPAR